MKYKDIYKPKDGNCDITPLLIVHSNLELLHSLPLSSPWQFAKFLKNYQAQYMGDLSKIVVPEMTRCVYYI